MECKMLFKKQVVLDLDTEEKNMLSCLDAAKVNKVNRENLYK